MPGLNEPAGHHTRDGLFFRRGRMGHVEVHASGHRLVDLPPNEWASAVAAVSQQGENADSVRAALEFHGL